MQGEISLKPVVGLKADAHTTGAKTGPGIDRRGFERAIITSSLDDIGSAGTLTTKLQHADVDADGSDPEDGDYADVTGGAMDAQTVAGVKRALVNLRACKAFIRVVGTVGTETVDAHVGVLLYGYSLGTAFTPDKEIGF